MSDMVVVVVGVDIAQCTGTGRAPVFMHSWAPEGTITDMDVTVRCRCFADEMKCCVGASIACRSGGV
jgi:hypothetical protein